MRHSHDAPIPPAIDSSLPVYVSRAGHRTKQNPPATRHFRNRNGQNARARRRRLSAESSAASKRRGIFLAKTFGRRSTGPESLKDEASLSWIDPAMVGKPFQADQQRIACERGGRGIRGIAVAQRPQRQNLPDSLPRRRERIDEAIGRRTKITDAAARGQRRGMQQNACGARKLTCGSITYLG